MKILLLLAILIAQWAPGKAVPAEGTEFLVAFPCLRSSTANLYIYVTNANTVPSSLSIFSSNPNFDPLDREVDARSSLRILFYDPDLQVCDNNVISSKGLLIQSTRSVSVYVDVEDSSGTRAYNFLVLPTSMIGKQYGLASSSYFSYLLVSLQDNTQVTLGNSATPIRLDRLEAYLITNSYPNITSSNPIAMVISSPSSDSSMALPNIYKSTEFPMAPHPNTSYTYVTVLGFEQNTYVLVNEITQGVVNAGTSLTFTVTQPSVITTSRRAQVFTGYYSSDQPAIQIVAPANYLSVSNLLFKPMTRIPYNSRDPVHTLEIIVPSASVGQIAIDGTTIPALQYKRISSSFSYYYVYVPVSNDQHVLTTTTSGLKYAASLYSSYYNSRTANAKFNIGIDLPFATKLQEI
jgi:hypothetical protein